MKEAFNMALRMLPTNLINQIAAGEVIERPASALKELVENGLDAGATSLEVVLRGGGKNLLAVYDNGGGMSPEELSLAIERHTTSKLPDEDLWNIRTFGFRGEALPSIGAISRLSISSRPSSQETGWKIKVEGGLKSEITPLAHSFGTRVEIEDLFFATPARLKFLKTDTTETSHALDILTKIAMAHPLVSFSMKEEGRNLLNLSRIENSLFLEEDHFFHRIRDILGKEFSENALPLSLKRDDISLFGLIGLPTLHRGSMTHQYLFVNRRPIKDRMIQAAIREAYQDLIPHGRYPMFALFLHVLPENVDVNVHPAKTEVRFREGAALRRSLMGALKTTLGNAYHKTSTTISQDTISSFQKPSFKNATFSNTPQHSPFFSFESQNAPSDKKYANSFQPNSFSFGPSFLEGTDIPSGRCFLDEQDPVLNQSKEITYPLGIACAQLHETYIVAQTEDSIVIVDQHAAHERLLYEKLKKIFSQENIERQNLLIPEVVELSSEEVGILLNRAKELEDLGLSIESFGGNALIVREVPALLGNFNIKALIKDLADELRDLETYHTLKNHLHEVCSSMACHGSVRAGKQMNLTEMNGLLREMEKTPFSGQCNHGRPTYVELKLKDVERLFGRS